jgi:hypothetical protein
MESASFSTVVGAFFERLQDHAIWLLGLVLMVEPILDSLWGGYRKWADSYLPTRARQSIAWAIIVCCVVVASFLSFRDQFNIAKEAEIRVQTLNGELAETRRQFANVQSVKTNEQNQRDDVKKGLQGFYEQGTELFKEGLLLQQSFEIGQLSELDAKTENWDKNIEAWVRQNMGEAALDRLLEVPNSPIRMNTSNPHLSETLTVIMHLKKNLSDLIETGAWDKVQ